MWRVAVGLGFVAAAIVGVIAWMFLAGPMVGSLGYALATGIDPELLGEGAIDPLPTVLESGQIADGVGYDLDAGSSKSRDDSGADVYAARSQTGTVLVGIGSSRVAYERSYGFDNDDAFSARRCPYVVRNYSEHTSPPLTDNMHLCVASAEGRFYWLRIDSVIDARDTPTLKFSFTQLPSDEFLQDDGPPHTSR